jgi:hypothetical protein
MVSFSGLSGKAMFYLLRVYEGPPEDIRSMIVDR